MYPFFSTQFFHQEELKRLREQRHLVTIAELARATNYTESGIKYAIYSGRVAISKKYAGRRYIYLPTIKQEFLPEGWTWETVIGHLN